MILAVFLGYVLLGLSLAAPIGPINAAQLDKGIKSGFFHSWMVGLGAMVADVIYMLLVFFGTVHFLDIPFMQTFLWLFGFFVLIYTGIESILGAGKIVSNTRKSDDSVFKSFLSGFLMSLSNPLTILFWLGIYGSVLARIASTYGTSQLILYSLAIISGITIWDITMAAVSSTAKRFFANKTLVFISILSGLTLIGFGVYFGIQAFKLLF